MKSIYYILILMSLTLFSNQVISADNWKFAYPDKVSTNVVNKLNEVPFQASDQVVPRSRRGCCWRLEDNEEFQAIKKSCKIKTQEKQYLGKIIGFDYKESINEIPSEDIKGFFVQVLRQKIENQIVPYSGEEIVYLPYVVVLKKELVTVLSIRNSGGTLLSNLAINLDKLIEFDRLSSVRHNVKDANTHDKKSYYLISARPVESQIPS